MEMAHCKEAISLILIQASHTSIFNRNYTYHSVPISRVVFPVEMKYECPPPKQIKLTVKLETRTKAIILLNRDSCTGKRRI